MPKIKNFIKSPVLEKLIKEYGGVTNFANCVGTDTSAVSAWLRGSDVKVPIKYALAIEMLTKGNVKARDLRPDIMKNYELVAR